MQKQTVLVIGSGGREHSLSWKLAQSPLLKKLYIAPGNAGTAGCGENVPIKANDLPGLLQFAKQRAIDITVVGPDDPLAQGIVDAFQKEGLRIFGPTKAAGKIEASKAYAKQLMDERNVPTATFETFTDHKKALAYAESQTYPLVIKASGLALGKGVYVCDDVLAARTALKEIMLDKVFGESGGTVVIEEFIRGQEVSIHAFCDGTSAVLFPPAQDHKQVFDGDKGPNTGGMGSYAPVPWVDDAMLTTIKKRVIRPILMGLESHGAIFTGCLFPGLMIQDDRKTIKTLEFNARFGDPETEVYMRLLKTDLLEIINACIGGHLEELPIEWSDEYAIGVVLASGGYPGSYKTGLPITGIAEAEATPGVKVFHAGTAMQDGTLVTNGGRVLVVTATAKSLQAAQLIAYEAVKKIQFEDMYYRTDIGDKGLR